MRVLVTGGAGFIGSHLVRRLVAQPGTQVVVLDDLSRRGSNSNFRFPDGVDLRRADICDVQAVSSAMSGADLVYHLAAISSVGAAQIDFGNAYRVNVRGTETILNAARDSGVGRVVFSSSREVYGESLQLPVPEIAPLLPRSAYGLTKAAGESCCRLVKGLDICILRLANVYGCDDFGRVIPIFLRNALMNQPLVIFGGEQLLDFIWIDDVIDALVTGGSSQVKGPLNIGSGIGTAITDLASRILRMTESSSPIRMLSRNDCEVMKFVADPDAARERIGLRIVSDPLEHLGEIVAYTRRQLVAGNASEALLPQTSSSVTAAMTGHLL